MSKKLRNNKLVHNKDDMKRVNIFIFCLAASLVFARPVHADVSETLATISGQIVEDSTASAGTIDPTFNQQMAELKAKYRTQLADYREDERLFIIAKQQNTQIHTLASLEEAVQRTRNVLVSRDQVLETYIEMLRLTVSNTRGIELSQKNDSLDNLLALQQSLKQHEIESESAVDRTKIAAAVVTFDSFSDSLDNVTAQAIARIGLGNLQEVYDKTQTIKDEVRENIEAKEQNPFTLAQKRRGFEEIDRTLTDLDGTLRTMRAQLGSQWERGGRSTLTSFVEDLTGVFSGLSRSISYLSEVLK